MAKPLAYSFTPNPAENDLHTDLEYCIPAWERSGQVEELITGTLSGEVPTWNGDTPTFASLNAGWSVPNKPNFGNQWTIAIKIDIDDGAYTGARIGLYASLSPAVDGRIAFYRTNTTDTFGVTAGGDPNGDVNNFIGSGNFSNGDDVFIVQRDGDTVTGWLNNVQNFQVSGYGTDDDDFGDLVGNNSIAIGKPINAGASATSVTVDAFYAWSRLLTPQERSDITADPWAVTPEQIPDPLPNITNASIIDNSYTASSFSSSTANTIVLNGDASAVDDFYNGCRIEIKREDSGYYVRYITDYDGTTKTATVDVDWDGGAPLNTLSVEIFSGRSIQMTFDANYTFAVQDTVNISTTPLFAESTNRVISTSNIERGNGTTTPVFTLPKGKPVNRHESISVTMDRNSNVSETAASAVNNSQTLCEPVCRLTGNYTNQFITGSFAAEAQALGIIGPGDGIAYVIFELTDGSTTYSSNEIYNRTESPIDGMRQYRATMDPSGLTAGEITLRVTAYAGYSALVTRQDELTLFYDDGTLVPFEGYITTSGTECEDDAGEGAAILTAGNYSANYGTAVNPGRHPRDICAIARALGGYDYVNINIMVAGSYKYGGFQLFGQFFDGPGYILPGSGLNSTNVFLIEDSEKSVSRMRAEYLGNTMVIRDCFINPTRSQQSAFSNTMDSSVCMVDGCKFAPLDRWTNQPNSLLDLPVGRAAGTSARVECFNMEMPAVKTLGGGFVKYRNVRIGHTDADVGQAFENMSNVTVVNGRKRGEPAMRISSTVPNSTWRKDEGQVVLADQNGIDVIFLLDAYGDIGLSNLVAEINSRPGWTCTQLLSADFDAYETNGDGSSDDGFLDSLQSYDVTTTPLDIYITSAFHADLVQFFQDDFENVLIDTAIDSTAQDPGNKSDQQVYWFDHAGPPSHNGIAAINVSHYSYNPQGNTRNGFHANMKNCVFAFHTLPDRRNNFLFGGQGSSGITETTGRSSVFTPMNFSFVHSIWDGFVQEGFGPAYPDTAIPDDLPVYIDNNIFTRASSLGDFEGTRATIESDIASMFVNYDADTAPVTDFNPVSLSTLDSTLNSDLTLHGLGDQTGNRIPEDGDGNFGVLQLETGWVPPEPQDNETNQGTYNPGTIVISGEDYLSVSNQYASARDALLSSSDFLLDAVDLIVDTQNVIASADLLSTFFLSYQINAAINVNPSPFLSSVRRLNNHVLNRGGFTTVQQYIDNEGIVVSPTWKDLSNAAGYTIL